VPADHPAKRHHRGCRHEYASTHHKIVEIYEHTYCMQVDKLWRLGQSVCRHEFRNQQQWILARRMSIVNPTDPTSHKKFPRCWRRRRPVDEAQRRAGWNMVLHTNSDDIGQTPKLFAPIRTPGNSHCSHHESFLSYIAAWLHLSYFFASRKPCVWSSVAKSVVMILPKIRSTNYMYSMCNRSLLFVFVFSSFPLVFRFVRTRQESFS
jgi:hypothetical protein